MPNVRHVATVRVYPNDKGSWTGVVRLEATREKESRTFENRDQARNWVKTRAWELCGPVRFAAYHRRGDYLANCWATLPAAPTGQP